MELLTSKTITAALPNYPDQILSKVSMVGASLDIVVLEPYL
jgi:hypothetical protein